jgi:hypothetical protein
VDAAATHTWLRDSVSPAEGVKAGLELTAGDWRGQTAPALSLPCREEKGLQNDLFLREHFTK